MYDYQSKRLFLFLILVCKAFSEREKIVMLKRRVVPRGRARQFSRQPNGYNMDILHTNAVTLPLTQLTPNEGQIVIDGERIAANPRYITDDEYAALKESIKADNLTGLNPLKVYEYKGQYVVIGGNMRLRAMRELGIVGTSCIIIPQDATAEVLRKEIITDNATFGKWDYDALANEWDEGELRDWGVNVPSYEQIDSESDDEKIERMRKEFEHRMEAGEISEEDEEYQEFLDKFKLKKTTDDCYTPELVYDAVADWVANEYGVNRKNFVRPFYPGGDYQNERYPKGAVVVDNPPFSIMSEILQFYSAHNIPFFLFGPSLTLIGSTAKTGCCAVAVGASVTYENGANVNTSFVTNLEKGIALRSAPTLYKAVDKANKEQLKERRVELPKYKYPDQVVTIPLVHPYSRLGIEFKVPTDECMRIAKLDAQGEDKAIYGSGYLISERLVEERRRLNEERRRLNEERRRLDEELAEQRAIVFELSERERAIVAQLSYDKMHQE